MTLVRGACEYDVETCYFEFLRPKSFVRLRGAQMADVTPNQELNPKSGSLSPLGLLNAARKAVPAVDYALGIVGVAAAVALVTTLIKGSGFSIAVVLGGMLVAMVLLYIFAILVTAKSPAVIRAGEVLLWAVVSFFCVFLVFTVTAVAIGWPRPIANVLHIEVSSSSWSFENCQSIADAAQKEFINDRSSVLRVEELIACKNPLGYSLRGAEKFYRGAYEEAERDFELALRYLPSNASEATQTHWKNNLASTRIETGKYREAIETFGEIIKRFPTDGFRWDLGRAYVYLGQNRPLSYQQAIETLHGVDRNYAGKTQRGKVEIVLAAAFVGQNQRNDIPAEERQSALQKATATLCDGIRKYEDFWRPVLRGSTPYPNASFREERRLLSIIGGGDVACSRAASNQRLSFE